MARIDQPQDSERAGSIFSPEKRKIRLVTALAILFLGLSLTRIYHLPTGSDILLGCILSLTNAFLGYLFFEQSFRFKTSISLFLSLTGMVLRFVLTIFSVALILIITPGIGVAGFVGAFMTSYAILMCFEVYYLVKRTESVRPAKVYAS